TNFIRQDVIETYQVSPDRVIVASFGVDPVFRPEADGSAELARLGVRRPYVLALGGAARRNLHLAVAAWQLATDDHDLVGVGTEPPPPQPGVYWAGPVDDAAWAGLLAGAQAFLYPTAYEGFGLPGVEAQGAGAPVVAARTSSLPEVLGADSACWAQSLAVEDLAAALSQLLSDETRQQSLRTAALAHAAAAPGWDQSAAAHLQAYALAAQR
ncbi:MAG: glycosyltransferase, partial [Pseudorhodobacter sp.]|nr:glycosyltransferase [Frankiaceae bacterium]